MKPYTRKIGTTTNTTLSGKPIPKGFEGYIISPDNIQYDIDKIQKCDYKLNSTVPSLGHILIISAIAGTVTGLCMLFNDLCSGNSEE